MFALFPPIPFKAEIAGWQLLFLTFENRIRTNYLARGKRITAIPEIPAGNETTISAPSSPRFSSDLTLNKQFSQPEDLLWMVKI